jgi:hypothetical protein
MNEHEAVFENARFVLARGDRVQDLVSALLSQLTDRHCPQAERIRLQAAADQLSAALRELHAATGISRTASPRT